MEVKRYSGASKTALRKTASGNECCWYCLCLAQCVSVIMAEVRAGPCSEVGRRSGTFWAEEKANLDERLGFKRNNNSNVAWL